MTVVDSKNCLTQMKGGGDPNASGGLSDWLRQVFNTIQGKAHKRRIKGWGGRSDCGEQDRPGGAEPPGSCFADGEIHSEERPIQCDLVALQVGKVNGGAEVVTAAHSVVPVETLLDLHAYDGESERPDKFEEKG